MLGHLSRLRSRFGAGAVPLPALSGARVHPTLQLGAPPPKPWNQIECTGGVKPWKGPKPWHQIKDIVGLKHWNQIELTGAVKPWNQIEISEVSKPQTGFKVSNLHRERSQTSRPQISNPTLHKAKTEGMSQKAAIMVVPCNWFSEPNENDFSTSRWTSCAWRVRGHLLNFLSSFSLGTSFPSSQASLFYARKELPQCWASTHSG